MKMNRLEKWMVNRRSNGNSGIRLARKLLGYTLLEPGAECLDVGCGRGVVSRFLATQYKAKVIGIDVDTEELEIARKAGNGAPVQFIEADARRLPFEDRCLDVIIMFGVLHHMADWQKAVLEAGRVLKVEGVLVLAELVYPDWITSLDERSMYRFGLYTLDISQLVRILQDEGCVTVHADQKKRLFWQEFEAVFQKKWEKAWSRV